MEDFSKIKPCIGIIQREMEVAKILSPEKLKAIWEYIKFTAQNVQLKLKLK